jgi:hypothetical protein
MVRDPVFRFASGLPDVSNVHRVNVTYACPPVNATFPVTLTFADGSTSTHGRCALQSECGGGLQLPPAPKTPINEEPSVEVIQAGSGRRGEAFDNCEREGGAVVRSVAGVPRWHASAIGRRSGRSARLQPRQQRMRMSGGRVRESIGMQQGERLVCARGRVDARHACCRRIVEPWSIRRLFNTGGGSSDDHFLIVKKFKFDSKLKFNTYSCICVCFFFTVASQLAALRRQQQRQSFRLAQTAQAQRPRRRRQRNRFHSAQRPHQQQLQQQQ